MPIYTKSGDQGTTCLYDGTKVEKSDKLLSLMGEIDELVSRIGTMRHNKELKNIQSELMALMSWIAVVNPRTDKQKCIKFYRPSVLELEISIDTLMKNEEIKSFIIPQSNFHLLRTQARKCERKFWKLFQNEKPWGTYLNRLSDYFYALALKDESFDKNKWVHPNN